jgi:hypothetical protein
MLVLHELATNAEKYGALSTNSGRVNVCWSVDDGDNFTMSWTERDGLPVSEPERRGFGTMVMKAIAEHSLEGAVDLNYAPSGLTWRLTCPAANALEPNFRCTRNRAHLHDLVTDCLLYRPRGQAALATPSAPWVALASYIQRKAGPAIGARSAPNRLWRPHVPDGLALLCQCLG